MGNGIKLKSGRIRALFEYDKEQIDSEYVLKELREDYSLDVFIITMMGLFALKPLTINTRVLVN